VSGANLYAETSAVIINTILADPNTASNCSAGITDGGHNLSSDGSCGLGVSSYRNTDPQLLSLADNGGLTDTMALSALSPAIGLGNDALAPSLDQRGMPRFGVSDIGAYEYHGPAVSLSGRVASTNGQAIANVTVSCTGGATTVTNSAGYYSFAGLTAALYTITPLRSGFSFSPSSRSVRVGDTNVSGVNFTGGQGFAATGRITNSAGTAIVGASVALSPRPSGVTSPVLTDSNGDYSFGIVPAGGYTVTPAKVGLSFSPATRTVSSTAPAATFTALFNVSGLVRTSSGAGLSGASITLRSSTGALPAGVANPVRTDSAGAYHFTNVPAGLYTLTPVKSGVSFIPASQGFSVTTAPRALNFTGTTIHRMQGRIATNRGLAISNVSVAISPQPAGVVAPVISNSAGYYLFTNLPNGTYTVTPKLSGYSFTPLSRVVVINNADALGQNFVGAQGFIASGHIATANGTPLANVAVTRSGSSAAVLTNSNGDYSLIVPNGSYTLTATLNGYSFTPASRNITVNGTNVTGQNFTGTAVPTYRIQGRIATSNGIGIPNVSVTRSGSSTPVLTNSAGYYLFTSVPNGSYTITPKLAGKTFTPSSKTVTVNGADALARNFIGAG
jgi:hypothetical protein